jgi:rfaE bifunctional protein kinase chain/domain
MPHSVQQQIVRVDQGGGLPEGADISAMLRAPLESALRKARGLLIADYGYGVVREELAAAATARVRGAGGVVSVDSRRGLTRFPGCSVATPNKEEAEGLLGEPIDDEPAGLTRQGERLRSLTRADAVLMTLGSRGMAIFRDGAPPERIPIYGSDEVADVTGAGDTVISALTLGLLAGLDLSSAAHLASVAAGLVVMKLGTATVSPSEIEAALRS